jgi:ATP-binding cassette subfamily D (ALD) long-chain fatty acid import protein
LLFYFIIFILLVSYFYLHCYLLSFIPSASPLPFTFPWFFLLTLLTPNRHRPSLLKYHNRHLRLGEPMLAPSLSMANLQGALGTPSTPLASQGWQLTKLASSNKEENLELEKEIERLEHVLGDQVGGWEQRLAEVTKELKGVA